VGDAELREVFKIIDADGNGTLSSEEFVQALRTKELETDNHRMTFEAFAMSMFEFVDYWAVVRTEHLAIAHAFCLLCDPFYSPRVFCLL
jgi:hypothetical protein